MQVTSRRGKTMAKKRSSVTETVDKTEPTLSWKGINAVNEYNRPTSVANLIHALQSNFTSVQLYYGH